METVGASTTTPGGTFPPHKYISLEDVSYDPGADSHDNLPSTQPQRDLSLRKPASDQSGLRTLLPTQQQYHLYHWQEVNARVAEAGRQSEQVYLQCADKQKTL